MVEHPLDKPGLATAGMLFGVWAGGVVVTQTFPSIFWLGIAICAGSGCFTGWRYAPSVARAFRLDSGPGPTIPLWEAISVLLLVAVEIFGSVYLAFAARGQVLVIANAIWTTSGTLLKSEFVWLPLLVIICLAIGYWSRGLPEWWRKKLQSYEDAETREKIRGIASGSAMLVVLLAALSLTVYRVKSDADSVKREIGDAAKTLNASRSNLLAVQDAAHKILAEKQSLAKALATANSLADRRLVEIQGKDGKGGYKARVTALETQIATLPRTVLRAPKIASVAAPKSAAAAPSSLSVKDQQALKDLECEKTLEGRSAKIKNFVGYASFYQSLMGKNSSSANDFAYEFSKWDSEVSSFVNKYPSSFPTLPKYSDANGELMTAPRNLDSDMAKIWRQYEGRKHWLNDYLDNIGWTGCD
jgi:hypothetical protein